MTKHHKATKTNVLARPSFSLLLFAVANQYLDRACAFAKHMRATG